MSGSAEAGQVHCARCSRDAAAVRDVPYGGALGEEIRARICAECWAEWMNMEVMVINELRLNFMDPEAQEVLAQQMRGFLALDDPPPA